MLRPSCAALLLLAACQAPRDDTGGSACLPLQVCAIMGTGELGFNGEDLPALETRLASPTSVTVDPDGREVVVDYSNMRIRVLEQDGTLVTLVGSGVHAYSEVGVGPLETPLENPVDAAWGPDGLLYILPQHEGRVVRVGADGLIEGYAGTGALGDSGDGGSALEAEMGFGGGMAFAPDGTLFISDNGFSRVRRVTPDGTIDTVLGTGSGGTGRPGYGPETAIWSPERLVVDADRNRLLVADTLNNRVLALDLDSLQVELVAGAGERGFAGDGGDAQQALLDGPVGVQISPRGAVLIADLGNELIRRVDPDGTIETVVGTVEQADALDQGPPLDFPLDRPAGMAWTPAGDLLVAERSGQRVLRFMGAVGVL